MSGATFITAMGLANAGRSCVGLGGRSFSIVSASPALPTRSEDKARVRSQLAAINQHINSAEAFSQRGPDGIIRISVIWQSC